MSWRPPASPAHSVKDMARNFPELTANASALKMQGVPAVASLAAALQIAMKSAGSADQAANNMSNFLGKITSPDTVKNFKKMGIDIEKEMKSAAAKGTDPLLHSLEIKRRRAATSTRWVSCSPTSRFSISFAP